MMIIRKGTYNFINAKNKTNEIITIFLMSNSCKIDLLLWYLFIVIIIKWDDIEWRKKFELNVTH